MIKELSLVNCQSWENEVLKLAADRVNILCADNNVGKSVFGKMLRNAVFPDRLRTKEVRMQYIRHGAPYAQLGMLGDDGAVVLFRIYPDRVIYAYREVGKDKFIMSPTIPDTMVRMLGLRYNDKSHLITNVIDAGQQLFLVNSDQQANNSSILEYMTDDEIEGFLAYMEELYRQTVTSSDSVYSRFRYVTGQLDELKHVNTDFMEQSINRTQTLMQLLDRLTEAGGKLHTIRQDGGGELDFGVLLPLAELALKCRRAEGYHAKVQSFNSMDYALAGFGAKVQSVSRLIGNARVTELGDYQRMRVIEKVATKIATVRDAIGGIHPSKLPTLAAKPQLLTVTEKVQEVLRLQRALDHSVQEAARCNCFIAKAREQLLQGGKSVDCAVYGKVVYDGKTCIPLGN